jgi:hypothetical protein
VEAQGLDIVSLEVAGTEVGFGGRAGDGAGFVPEVEKWKWGQVKNSPIQRMAISDERGDAGKF